MAALYELHAKGVKHGDIRKQNVVIESNDEGKLNIRVIDSDRAEEHQCPLVKNRELKAFGRWSDIPPFQRAECEELYIAGKAFAFWTDGEQNLF